MASLTKLMTAYVVLHDHPLALGQPGPTITVTPGRRRRLRQRHRQRRLQRRGDVERADPRGTGPRRHAGALGRQLRRPPGHLGRREHARLRGEDERRRVPPRHGPLALRRRQRRQSRIGVHRLGPAQGGGPRHGRSHLRLHGQHVVRHAARRRDDLDLHAAPRRAGGDRREVRLHLGGGRRRRARGGPHRARQVGAAAGRGDRADRPGGAGAGGTARPGAGRRPEPVHRLHPGAVAGPGGGPRQRGGQHASAPRPRRRSPCSPGPGSARHGSSCRHATWRSRPAVARRSGPSSSPSAPNGSACRCGSTGDIPPRTLLQRLF